MFDYREQTIQNHFHVAYVQDWWNVQLCLMLMSQVFDPITVFLGQLNNQYFEFLPLNGHCLPYNLFRFQEKNRVIMHLVYVLNII